jgi:hypothetical protein
MKQKFVVMLLLSVISLSAIAKAGEEKSQNRSKESVIGTWKGKFEETPAVDIALKVDSGKLVGTAIFYFVQNTDNGAEVKATEKSEMIEPNFDGSNLLFRIKRKDGSFFKARIKFIAENEAVLKPVDEPNATEAMAISLIREP